MEGPQPRQTFNLLAADRSDVRFLLITVTDASVLSRAHLSALLQSLEQQSIEVDLVLVMRGAGTPPQSPSAKIRIHLLRRPEVIGLSCARNDALAHAREHGLLGAADVVGFPDDDCRYPDGLLARVATLIDTETGIVSGTYGPTADEVDHGRFPSEELPLSQALVMRTISSNNVFFAARVVSAVGDFDERLGLGARYGAAEDNDYVLRALRIGVKGAYWPREVFVEHPYKPHRPSQYYVGNVAVEAKHALGGGTCLLMARRLAIGLGLVLRRTLTPRDYLRAVWAAGCQLAESPWRLHW
jgi:glycosyltransferase involved in cell wall biosynthesis